MMPWMPEAQRPTQSINDGIGGGWMCLPELLEENALRDDKVSFELLVSEGGLRTFGHNQRTLEVGIPIQIEGGGSNASSNN